MSRIRVLDLAKELGIETKTVIAKLQEWGVQVKNHFNAVSDADAAKLRSTFSKSGKPSEKETDKKPASKIFIRRKAETPTETQAEQATETAAEIPVISSEPVIESAPSKAIEVPVTPTETEKKPELTLQKEEVAAQITPQKDETTPSPAADMQEEKKITLEKTESTSSQKEIDNKMETKQPISPPATVKPPQAPVVTPPRTTASSTGAVIIRRADPKEAQQQPSSTSYHRPQGGNGYSQQQRSDAGGRSDYRGNNGDRSDYRGNHADRGDYRGNSGERRPPYNNYSNQQDSNRRYQPGQGSSTGGGYQSSSHQGQGGQSQPYNRPGQGSSSGSGYTPRYQGNNNGSTGGGYNRPQSSGSGSGQGRPFAPPPSSIPDSTINATKDMSSRFKDRDKDREKQRKGIEDEETRNKNALRLKGSSRFQDSDDFSELEFEAGHENEGQIRTIIPNRRKSSTLKKKETKRFEAANPTKASKKVIRIDESISVNDLAGELSQKATAVIKTLMKLGMMANINQQLDFDTATFVAQEFGYETQNASVSIDEILAQKTNKHDENAAESRPPIITIMGHVDHGKTSLLDAIRSENVASKEAGGITQHIGAYQITYQGRKLTFLDTPGHEAFTAMRSRGAQVTDIVVLVVAADDGVMPQSIEAIAHAKAAGVPIIVAINKIDKPGVNFERITKELADHGVLPEEWGGDTMFVKVSAKTHEGLSDLIESILLQSDVLDLKAPQEGLAEGIVIEAKLDKARGPVATVIITKGLLKQQDSLVVGTSMGRVRALFDDRGQKLTSAGPSTPVELIGLGDVPQSGDRFNCVANDTIAKEAVAYRIEKQRQKDLASQRGSTMEDLLAMMGNPLEEKPKELSIIIKADTHGSSEAIKAAIQKLDTPKVKSKIILSAVGGITETDAILAKASQAIIVGFNVRPDRMATQYAERSGVKIQSFSIIYELLEFVESSMLGTLAPTKLEKVIGHAEVRNTFSVPKVGIIAGSMVTDGKIARNSQLRVVRDGIVVYTGKLGSLKRFKDDAKEVAQGFECGISVENYNDLKVGDVLEAFVIEEIAPTLH